MTYEAGVVRGHTVLCHIRTRQHMLEQNATSLQTEDITMTMDKWQLLGRYIQSTLNDK